MIPTPTTDLPLDAIALGAAETWARPDRDGIFARLRDVAIFDPAPDLCPGKTCAVERDGKPLYFDDNHLSAVGVNAYEGELGTLLDRELAKAPDRRP